MVREAALVALAVAAASCGGSAPAAPSPPAAVVLTAGAFTLNIFPAPAEMNPGLPVVCSSTNGGAGTSISIPVDVQADGPAWVARPSSGTLRLTLLQVGPGMYYGPLEGAFTLGGTTVTFGSGGEPAIAGAFLFGATVLTGPIDGTVRYTSGNGLAESSCNRNAWSLVRR